LQTWNIICIIFVIISARIKNILITGCAGFIGSNLTLKLVNQGHQVFGIDNLSFGSLKNLKEIGRACD
jgi:nucleoside-diphosphate-sugar epimerase